MKLELQIIGVPQLPAFEPNLGAAVIEEKETALSISALIGRVTNRKENDAAVDAMKRLKNLSNGIERQRKEITEPFIEIQRALKRMVDGHREELDRENGRLECLVKDFTIAEQRRIRDEQEAQERELKRIEAERQAELKRIADEQARIEREAREAREAAERAAREATNKAQREAAAKQMAEAEAQRKEAEKAAAIAAQEAAQVQAAADAKSALEAKPIEITKANGQTTRKVWAIKSINEALLARMRPDLVRKYEFDMVAIKEILNSGQKLPGVTAEEDLRIGTRGGATKTIDV